MTRRWLDAAGLLLGLVAIGFVALRLQRHAGELHVRALLADAGSSLALIAAVSGLANGLLALAWRETLAEDGVQVTRRWALRAHGVSQLGRYVPGNVFQFAGRQALGMAAGLPGALLAKSVLRELGSLAVIGVALAPPALELAWAGWAGPRPSPSGGAARLPPSGLAHGVPLSALSLAAALLVALLVARRIGHATLRAALWHTAFLLVYSGVFVAVLGVNGVALDDWNRLPVFASAFVVAWLAGLVTPGAPAGGGVRETVLLFLLGAELPPHVLVLSVVLGRAVNVVGDVAWFLVSLALRAPVAEAADA